MLMVDFNLGHPEKTGLDIIKWNREQVEPCAETEVLELVVSADSGPELLDNCKAMGVPFMNKPINKKVLGERIMMLMVDRIGRGESA